MSCDMNYVRRHDTSALFHGFKSKTSSHKAFTESYAQSQEDTTQINRQKQVDNKHQIRDPISNDPVLSNRIRDAMVWSKTITQGRVSELYKSVLGIPGHVQQIQQEINRVSQAKLGDANIHPAHCKAIVQGIANVMNAIKKAKAAVIKEGRIDPNHPFHNYKPSHQVENPITGSIVMA
ncbi:MAG: hypothetical protein WB791_06980 [Waddliaceae bacterium]